MKVHVKVIPNSSRSSVSQMEDGTMKVKLTTAPVDGKANEALIKVLAKYYGVTQKQVVLVKGKTSKNKVIEIKKSGE